jgi:hypothetical protein
MKCLSMKPWWLWSVMHAGQRILSRNWMAVPDYRGPLLLHASAGKGGQAAYGDDWLKMARAFATMGLPITPPPREDLPRSAILARARLDGVIRTEEDFASYAANVPGGAEQRWWWYDRVGLVLADVEILAAPIPMKGTLGLFDVPDDVLGVSVVPPAPPPIRTYEIINPSDEAYLDAPSDVVAVAALCFLGEGAYLARAGEGARGAAAAGPVFRGPLFMLGGHDEWFEEHAGVTFEAFAKGHLAEIAAALKTTRLTRERSSLDDLVGRAHAYAEAMEQKLTGDGRAA